jgi:hypothetical protein
MCACAIFVFFTKKANFSHTRNETKRNESHWLFANIWWLFLTLCQEKEGIGAKSLLSPCQKIPQRTNEQTHKRTYDRTNEQINERTNEQKNKRKNKRTHDRRNLFSFYAPISHSLCFALRQTHTQIFILSSLFFSSSVTPTFETHLLSLPLSILLSLS